MKVIESEINLDDFKSFVLFEMYYQNMLGLNLSDNIRKCLNKIMDYHFMRVFGKEYNNKFSNIIDEKYKCIITLDEN